MILTVEPLDGNLRGELTPPGDKSMSHRALIFSSLATGCSEISGLLESEDTLATMKACEQLGAVVERRDGKIFITGTGGELKPPKSKILEMGNSGTAMRLLAGVLSGQKFDSVLSGDESLNGRPMRRIVEPLKRMGATINPTDKGTAPLQIQASQGLQGIEYQSPLAITASRSLSLTRNSAAPRIFVLPSAVAANAINIGSSSIISGILETGTSIAFNLPLKVN